ncbi:MAG: LacI family DNA-binding transcriptional regulator [Tagaea sp.]|nr:LacI family DNA-binding transcriptional regulator [Tagaea sp.]
MARLAGVSRSTVSRVFTAGADVAKDTRDRVDAAAAALGYRPNVIARSLTMQKTRLVGVIVGDVENPFYAALLRNIGTALQARGMSALVFIARFDELDGVVDQVLSYQVAGLIVTSAAPRPQLVVECQKARVPIVLINRPSTLGGVNSVSSDNLAGTGLIAAHLVALGCRKIAYLAGIGGHGGNRERETGLALALGARGLAIHASECGDFTAEGATAAARALLSRGDRPDAIVCANDIMAAAAIDVARHEFGLSPGRDIRITGYDNSPTARLRAYRITSIDQSVAEIANAAVELAATATAHSEAAVVVNPRLVARHSTIHADD